MKRSPFLQVSLECPEIGVFQNCDRNVASLTEQSADVTCQMIMIDRKTSTWRGRPSANGAEVGLFSYPLIVFLKRNAVNLFDFGSTLPCLRCFGAIVLMVVGLSGRALTVKPNILALLRKSLGRLGDLSPETILLHVSRFFGLLLRCHQRTISDLTPYVNSTVTP